MTPQLRAEWIKLRSTRLGYGVLAVHVGITLLQVVLIFVNAGRINTPSLGTTESVLRLIAASSYGQYIALVLGVLLVGSEYRHQTITATFVVRPARGAVVAAKAALGGLAGGTVSLVGLLATAAVVIPWLSALGVDIDVAHVRYLRAAVATVVVAAAYGVMGAGLGALIPNATAAVGAAVGYGIVVENLLVGAGLPQLMPWVPGGAAIALIGARPLTVGHVGLGHAAVVLVAYAAALVALGLTVTTRRDVT